MFLYLPCVWYCFAYLQLLPAMRNEFKTNKQTRKTSSKFVMHLLLHRRWNQFCILFTLGGGVQFTPQDRALTRHRVSFSHVSISLLPIKSGINGKMQLRELNREQRFPQLPPWVCSSSVLLLGKALHLGLCSGLWAGTNHHKMKPLTVKSHQGLQLCRGCGTHRDQPSRQQGVLWGKIVTSQQPGLFLTKFYCKFLLKDILIIYKL